MTPRRQGASPPEPEGPGGVATAYPPAVRRDANISLPLARLVPYHRAVFPRGTLYSLWSLMEEQGAAPLLFHGQQGPEQTRGDLVAFVRMLEPAQGETHVLLVTRPDSSELEGFLWFDDVVGLGENAGTRAAFNVFYRRRFWGHPAREASRMGLRYGFEVLKFSAIWAWTPWVAAMRHAAAIGMTQKAHLSGFASEGRDLAIFRALPGEVRGGV